MRRIVSLAAALTLVAACTGSSGEGSSTTVPPPPTTTIPGTTTAPTTTPTTTTPPAATTTTLPWAVPVGLSLVPFAALAEIPLLGDDVPYPGPVSPSTLSGVRVSDYAAALLERPGVQDALIANGFVVVPTDLPLFHSAYDQAIYGEVVPVFVTTDAAYHTWHLVFDKVLREIEQQVLLPLLDEMVLGLVQRARDQQAEFAGTPLEEPAGRVVQFFEAAALVLDLDVGAVGPLARDEEELIRQHARVTASPITSYGPCEPGASTRNCVDYTLYKPRGHYTRNADLERYFRGMSVLGNSAFFLDADSLRLGLLASRVLLSDPALVQRWQLIYEPTAFLVGAADDYTPFEAATAAAQVTPDGLLAPLDFAEAAAVVAVAEELKALRPVLINPEGASVRLMGVRLLLDTLILDQLVHPSVPGRYRGSPLDVAAAFGSEWALDEMERTGMTDYPEYPGQLEAMRALVGRRTMDGWGATVYDAWLYALEPMWSPHGEAFPGFMRGEQWSAKSHQTGFASYTELKHDTILYGKQAIAEFGLDRPAVEPRHWVEPDPVVFQRIAATARLLNDGLDARNLLSGDLRSLLADLIDWVDRLAVLAADELAAAPLSDDDKWFLEGIGGYLEQFWTRSSDYDVDPEGGPDDYAALVADVMRNPDEILELGTGYIDYILVLAPGDDGVFQVAVGGVYSYYEFWTSGDDRLTDEEWRALLIAGEQPDRPAWQEVFLAGP